MYQPCTLVQCEVRGQGNVCEVCEYSVRERGGFKDTVVWVRDNAPCTMNTLTAGTMLIVAATYLLECTQCA